MNQSISSYDYGNRPIDLNDLEVLNSSGLRYCLTGLAPIRAEHGEIRVGVPGNTVA